MAQTSYNHSSGLNEMAWEVETKAEVKKNPDKHSLLVWAW